ncbi:phosphodiester glycosidase family protein [Streptomyces tsukubensis]|uniref:Multidrug transporter n=1 Tax=Streptomyces tsukubensis TaxID=83656 RepID=A0A1V4ACR4_9ACTN|nr:phosphodiester glycosidase family protein [Streptomyces tsukubensis]OON81764.1 multidrug transporter [Streptomyces tsukubensis]QFR96546.1 multidrug transporter [Streptomyces tsukubensis]
MPRTVPVRPVTVLAVLAASAALLTGAPAYADERPDPGPVAPPAASGGDRVLSYAEGDGLETARTSRPVAPGTRLTSYDRLESDKWLRVDELSVDLGAGTKAEYLHPDKVSERQTVSQLAEAHDAGRGRRTVAAINGDFFDINETGAPTGVGVDGGRLVNSPAPGHTHAVGFGPADTGRLLDLYFEGTLTLPSGATPLAGLNAANVPAGSIGGYTAQWGEADRALTVNGAKRTAEVTVVDGRTTERAHPPGTGSLPADATVLVGSDAGADRLTELPAGAPVSWAYHPRASGGTVPAEAIGANEYLVTDGHPVDHEGEGNNLTAPRTAVGFSKDGHTAHIVTVDGRQADSGGLTLTELGVMMKRAGSYNAVNLDGGGSSTLVARTPGSDTTRVENQPSDGSERLVPNGLALTAPDGSGTLTGYWTHPAMDAGAAPTDDPVLGGHPDRVFPGLTRELRAEGHDETYGPAPGTPRWRVDRPALGRVDGHGTFTARATGRSIGKGTVAVTAARGRARGSVHLRVLGELDRIAPTTGRIALEDPATSDAARTDDGASTADDALTEGAFGIVGFDARGDSAPVEPSDVRLDYDHALFTVTATDSGFTVKARGTRTAGTIRATVAGRTTSVAVSVGLEEKTVSAFDDAGRWTFSQARASGSLAATPEGHTGTGLSLTYDFTRSTATRAAYATPPAPVAVAGQPQAFTLWINGDGKGAWATLHLKDAAGSDQLLRGPHITWTGWQQVRFTVPDSVAYPVSVSRFYLAETAAAAQYAGKVTIDDLTAEVPPEAELPARPVVKDPIVSTATDVRGKDWRFAVMSDAQFVARAPDSDIVRQARRTLREIKASRPDFLVINGDLVDEGSPADLAFARRVLTEELGDTVPWYYVPGNHEVMGGSLANFTTEFGPAQRVFDHRGTRFITLDTSSLGIRTSGFDQLKQLRAELDEAAEDKNIGSVTLIQHVPPRDPTPQKGSQLSDRKEAALVENWLSAFHRESGKGAAFIGGHVGTFHASRVDGVPYLINGNSGKMPATPAAEGGFTGWSTVGIDRSGRGDDWIRAQTRAHVDDLTLKAPDELAPGRSAPVTATVTQGTRAVPVDWPMSADWTGSPNLHIGAASNAGHRHIATYDPATGRLTALRRGTATLSVTVNGAVRRVSVRVGNGVPVPREEPDDHPLARTARDPAAFGPEVGPGGVRTGGGARAARSRRLTPPATCAPAPGTTATEAVRRPIRSPTAR